MLFFVTFIFESLLKKSEVLQLELNTTRRNSNTFEFVTLLDEPENNERTKDKFRKYKEKKYFEKKEEIFVTDGGGFVTIHEYYRNL